MDGAAVASCAADSSEAFIILVLGSGSFSSGLSVFSTVTSRSGLSDSTGVSFGRSTSFSVAFCSTTGGEGADASLSGPGGNSEGVVWVEASSNAISMPGAPRSSSSGSVMRQSQRPQNRDERSRQKPLQISRCFYAGSGLQGTTRSTSFVSALLAPRGRDNLVGRCTAFQCNERDLGVAAEAEYFEHVHHVAVRYGAIRSQKYAAILVRIFVVECSHQVDPFYRRFTDCNRKIGLDRYVSWLVGLCMRDRAGGWKVNREIDGRERRRDHEDNEQNQHDIDKRRDVDFVGFAENVFVVDICEGNAHELLRRAAH